MSGIRWFSLSSNAHFRLNSYLRSRWLNLTLTLTAAVGVSRYSRIFLTRTRMPLCNPFSRFTVLLRRRLQGSWAPSMNVPTLLTTIRLLMAHPNGDDGLMPDIVSFGGSSCFRALVFCRAFLMSCPQTTI